MEITQREKEIITLKAKGLTQKQIAAQLFRSEKAIEKDMDNLFFKLGIRKSSQLIVWAYENGILEITRENLPYRNENEG